MQHTLQEPYVQAVAGQFGPEFDVSTGILLRRNGAGLYEVQRQARWRVEGSDTVVGVVGIGGKYEGTDGTLVACAQRECSEELETTVALQDSTVTHLFTSDTIREFSIPHAEGLIRPRYIIVNQQSESGRKPYTLVAVFEGELQGEPTPGDVAGLLYLTDEQLQQAFQRGGSRLEDVLRSGAVLNEKIDIPRDVLLKVFGTAQAHLRYLTQ